MTAFVVLALCALPAAADGPVNILKGLSPAHYWVQGCVKFANRTSGLANVIYLGNDSPPQAIGGTTAGAPWVDADGANCQQRGDANQKDIYVAAYQNNVALAATSNSMPAPPGYAALPPGIETLQYSWASPGTNTPAVSLWLKVYRSCPQPWCPSPALTRLLRHTPATAPH